MHPRLSTGRTAVPFGVGVFAFGVSMLMSLDMPRNNERNAKCCWLDCDIAVIFSCVTGSTEDRFHTIGHCGCTLVKYLTSRWQSGANPNIPDKRGNTPLHVALECKIFTIVQLLLKYNDTNLEAKNLKNQKPLAPLITHGVPFLLELLHAWHGTPPCLTAQLQ
ncbi:hypothetical protein Pelo_1896 [Pelomyxa schiedti]|nr:hypothetical protein Pelo_1896 [Pelomyxa schiedti]